MIIERAQPSVLILEGIKIKPGINVLTEEQAEKLNGCDAFGKMLNTYVNGSRLLSVKNDVNDTEAINTNDGIIDIPKKADDKIKLIKATLSYEALDTFGIGETRKGVLRAIDEQRAILTDHRENYEGEGMEDG